MIHLESLELVNIIDNGQNNSQIKKLTSLTLEVGYHDTPLLAFMGSYVHY